MTKKIFLLMLTIFPILCNSQEYVDIFTINYRQSEDTSFENTNKNTTIESFQTEVIFPIVLKSKNVLITGINYSSSSLQLFPSTNYNHFYTTRLTAGISINHSEKWKGNYILLPKIASDYKNISHNDFYIGGLLEWKYKKNKNLNYRFGLYASTEAFGIFTTPIFGLYYTSPNERLEINLSLPIVTDINYRIQKNITIGFDYIGLGDSYKFMDENKLSEYYTQNNSLEFSTYIQYSIFNKSVLLRLKSGYSTNKFEVYSIDEKNNLALSSFRFGDYRTQLNSNLTSNIFFKVEAKYRFHITSKKH